MLLFKANNTDIDIDLVVYFACYFIGGLILGILSALTEQLFEYTFFQRISLWGNIIYRVILYYLITILLLWLFVDFIFDRFRSSLSNNEIIGEYTWVNIFYMILVYNFMVILVLSFVTEVSKKFAPNMMWPLIIGKYRTPRVEERIFMFMDLRSSTTIAEELGHVDYSRFLRSCFIDINSVLSRFNGEIYQYVGDEVVITWRISSRGTNMKWGNFYFECQRKFENRSSYYEKNFGHKPFFKAGAHIGFVSVVEIGVIKKEIAFHGDTLNTTARIQELCNHYNQSLLISETLSMKISGDHFEVIPIAELRLRGKIENVMVMAVEQNKIS
ncbi:MULTISPECIES: adenylate/guanylate cyclase domain-containing protein [Sphingobacterium]|uniref:adenylate/guanylate cyclase domain-containing protein n=1 Tax=Sphingobacterium TaxID=28453 RepID=UPI00140486C5|nr:MULTISPECIES: adenylate/guanylate cyclase domain-containing protein [Sphingobacterium]MCW2263067.1 adenylate cyclase [Sphingobacterium kitahiroshimense]